MTLRGLPPLDVPRHEQDPNSCKKCVHSFYAANDPGFRYLRCSRGQYSQLCCYERDKDGECGPAALHWKERNT